MLKNRKVAVMICVIVIALSILSGARRSLSEVIRETEDAFVYGVAGDGRSIYHDLGNRAQLANNLVTIAERYLDPEEDTVSRVRVLSAKLQRESQPGKCYDLNEELAEALCDLNAALLNEPLSETDEGYRQTIMTNLVAYDELISQNGYNKLVRKLNEETLKEFPARLLKLLTLTGNAEYYG